MAQGNNHFSWSDASWTMINQLIHDEGAHLRKARRDEGSKLPAADSGRIFALFGPQEGNFLDHVRGYTVTEVPNRTNGRKQLSISAGQNLVPAKIWVNFELSPEQYNDENTAAALATKAAYKLALAEDFVILLGDAAETILDKLNVTHQYLSAQPALFRDRRVVKKPILESIVEGIERLREKNHHVEYCAIVSPDLYREAFAPRQSTIDAPIYEIRPLLKENGFTYSPALPDNSGVVFSLGGRTIDMAVPVDAR